MLRAMIVDDEMMVRTALEKMVDWQAEGFVLDGCYPNGKAALDALERHPADLIFTDIRMPVCDGLELIDRVHAMGLSPYIVVLSAFDDFPQVKQAFKKGAADYVLKQEVTSDKLLELVREAKEKLPPSQTETAPADSVTNVSTIFGDVFFHNADPHALGDLEQGYVIGCFFLDEIYRELPRLGGDVHATLTQPLTSLVMQMPQMKQTDGFYSLDVSRHFVFYSLTQPGRTVEKARAFFALVQKAWKNYMNISCTVGLAFPHKRPADVFYKVLEQAETNTTLRYVLGPGRIYDESYYTQFDPVTALRQAKSCMPFIRAVMNADFAGVERYKNELVGAMQDLPLAQGQSLALLYLYNLYYEMGFYDMQIAYKLGLDHQLYARIRGIETQRDLVIYFTSALRRIMEYFESNYDQRFPDSVLKAKRYLEDNYMRAELSLKEVSDHSGYNEKYFCTLFKKRFEVSYSDYLNQLRVGAAKDLLEKSDMRMYQIADAVGYNNVEHFMRVFKKVTGTTPKQYRKENVKKYQ
ncbi:AraC family transcriptional regulator [uncultured Ruthenibacterium sp.]|uniref:response regulator transcription factor n=1 Tax=uncultured Ruthenibacterium sp. TaxID=1905347 RepID=UPI00349EC8CA